MKKKKNEEDLVVGVNTHDCYFFILNQNVMQAYKVICLKA
jgi:hypothetical protein